MGSDDKAGLQLIWNTAIEYMTSGSSGIMGESVCLVTYRRRKIIHNYPGIEKGKYAELSWNSANFKTYNFKATRYYGECNSVWISLRKVWDILKIYMENHKIWNWQVKLKSCFLT